MEIQPGNLPVRKCICRKNVARKDGTIKTYIYEREYTPKTNHVKNAGKTDIKKRFDACKDLAVIQAVSDLLEESGY